MTDPARKDDDIMDTDDDMNLGPDPMTISAGWANLTIDPVLLNEDTLGHGTILPHDEGMADAPFELDETPYTIEEQHFTPQTAHLDHHSPQTRSAVRSQQSFPPEHQFNYIEPVTPRPPTNRQHNLQLQTPPFSEPSIPRLNATAEIFEPGSVWRPQLLSPPRSHAQTNRDLSVGSEMLQESYNGNMTPTSAASARRRQRIFTGASDSPVPQEQHTICPYPTGFEPAPLAHNQPIYDEDYLAPAANSNGTDTGTAAVHDMQRWVEGGPPTFGTIPSRDRLSPAAATQGRRKRSASHASQGSFACTQDDCSKTFATKAERDHHQRYHGNRDHACGVCGKGFHFPKDLKRHTKIHNPRERHLMCTILHCKYHTKGFHRQDHLDRHLNKVHGIQSGRNSTRGNTPA